MMLRRPCMLLLTTLVIAVDFSAGQTVETRAGERVVIMSVGHIESDNQYCFGELLISRNRVTYTVEYPAEKANHGFEISRESIEAALPGEQADLRYIELRLKGGLTTQYFHLANRESGNLQVDSGNTAIFVAPAAIDDFDRTVEILEAGPVETPTGPLPPPEVDRSQQIVRYLVAHADEQDTYCYGWLSISRDGISYEVLWPDDKALHGWSLNRAEIAETKAVDRKGWRWIEIHPTSGRVQAFGNAQEAGFGYYAARPHEFGIFDVLKTYENFESEWRRVQETLTEVDEGCVGTVWIRSDPSGAEIYVDGEFVGSTPAKLTLNAGLRKILVKKDSFPEWVRDVKINCDAIINLPVSWE